METKSRNKGFFAVLSPKSHTCLHGMEEFFFFKCWVKYPNCLPFANERETFRCTPLPVTNRIGSVPGSPYILTFHCHIGSLTSKRIYKLFWLLTPWSNTIIQEWWVWKLAIVKTFLHPWPHPEPWILEREYQVLVFFPWISSDFFRPCQGYERQLTPNEAVVSGVCVCPRESLLTSHWTLVEPVGPWWMHVLLMICEHCFGRWAGLDQYQPLWFFFHAFSDCFGVNDGSDPFVGLLVIWYIYICTVYRYTGFSAFFALGQYQQGAF